MVYATADQVYEKITWLINLTVTLIEWFLISLYSRQFFHSFIPCTELIYHAMRARGIEICIIAIYNLNRTLCCFVELFYLVDLKNKALLEVGN